MDLTHIRRNPAGNGGETVVEKRADITESQAEYLERAFGDDCKSDAEVFRTLIREHRRMSRLLDLDEHADDAPDE